MKKIGLLAIYIGVSIVMTGCGKASEGGADGQGQVQISSVSEGINQTLLEQLENLSFDVEGYYIEKRINNEMVEKEVECPKSYTGNLKEINLISQHKDEVVLEALLANDFYTTTEPVPIVFPMENNILGSGVIEDNHFKVKPVIPYPDTLDWILNEDLKVTITPDIDNLDWELDEDFKVNFQEGSGVEEFTITPDTVEKIQYEYETGKITGSFCRINDFGYSGRLIFNCKDGRKIKQDVDIYYRPDNEKYTSESNKLIWGINKKKDAKLLE